MFLFPLALLAAIALTIWFVLVSEAPVIAKVVVCVLFFISLFLHPSRFPLAGFFLQIAIAICLLLYQMAKEQ